MKKQWLIVALPLIFYWFVHNTYSLSTTPNWEAVSDQAKAGFASSVHSTGDVNGDGYSDIIVGAPLYDNGEADEGRVFVYYGSAAGLSSVVNWTAEPNQTNAKFGTSVSGAGDINGDGYSDIIVGAPFYDNVEANEGRVFVYYGSATGLLADANWTAESNQMDANFGTSVSCAGDVNDDGYSDVIVGAPYYTNGESAEGWAYVYYGSATGLSAAANWTVESNQMNTSFGISVSSAGDVNGDSYSDVIVCGSSQAKVYHGGTTGLSITANWTANNSGLVSSAGDVNGDGYSDVIVGSAVYYGSALGLSVSANWISTYIPCVLANAGDVNGDGYSDVIMGIENNTKGGVILYYGGATGLSTIANWIVQSYTWYSYFGNNVSSAGDVNGDGYSDILVGSPGIYDGGNIVKSTAYVLHGSIEGYYAPQIISTSEAQLVYEGQPAKFSVIATAPRSLSYQWTAVDGVGNLSALTANYTIPITTLDMIPSGNPYALVACKVSCGNSSVTTSGIKLKVFSCIPPVIGGTLMVTGRVGIPFRYAITATGLSPISFVATGLPAGLSVSTTTGTITGTPTAAGVYTVTITATNGGGTGTAQLSITLYPANYLGDFNVVAWGSNTYGETSIPFGLTNVKAIDAGRFYTVALKEDGTVVAWGENSSVRNTIPVGLTHVKAIAAGGSHTVALKEDGTVVAWGNNGNGETSIPYGLTNVKAIAAGSGHTIALKEDGTIVAWGYDANGQTTIPYGLTNVKAIAAGDYYSVALKEDGTVVAWGHDTFGYGQTIIPVGLTNVKAIDAGGFHTVALKEDGTVVAWGKNSDGQTTIPLGLTNVKAIAAGEFHTVALKEDGTLVAWGDAALSQIPVGLPNLKAISAGWLQTVALTVSTTSVNPYPGDLNGDGVVNIDDLFLVVSHFGQTSEDIGWNLFADANNDHIVNIDDLTVVIANFGKNY